MYFACSFSLLLLSLALVIDAQKRIPALNSYNPGLCDKKSHGKEVLVKDKADKEIILICVNDQGVYRWKPTDGMRNTVGEYFNPGYDCSEILDKQDDSKDGFYWIHFKHSKPKKVWCDMTTDGGGFMLIGRKNSPVTWTVPSSNIVVKPYGKPHWSSSLGHAPILDFRIQMAVKEDFKATKSHWFYRLQSKRPLKNLMMNTAGCNQRSAGIGDIAYVKDLLTEKIVTTKLRCSKFGFAYPDVVKFGWHKMNSCLQKPCPWGFAFHDLVKQRVVTSGGFSFSTSGSISGMEHNATSFVGCDNGVCCGCYGPVGGTKDYCAENCKAINGGTVTKNLFTWFWVRSSLPKRLWKKCMDYQVKRNDGKLISYKLVGHGVIPVKGACAKDSTLLHDGVVVVPDSSTAQKVPAIDGLLEYRKDKQELYIRSNKTWNALAQKEKILQESNEKDEFNLEKIKKLEQNLNKEKKTILQEIDKKQKQNSNKFKQLKQNLDNQNKTVDQRIGLLESLAVKLSRLVLPRQSECYGYKWLTESNRNKKYPSGDKCDSGLSGWYRFGGGAGNKMPTTCVARLRCGSAASGWMNGSHPTVADGKVTRKVCYSWTSGCCWQSNNIEVINCGQYYVYKLIRPPNCDYRYCGSDN